MKRSFLIIAALLASFNAYAQDFYKGKTITLLVNYGAGGNADTDARLLARHWGRHIPGGPTIVVQNVPGAGGLRAMNMLGKKAGAEADGFTAGFFTVSPTPPLVDDPGLQVSMTDDLIPIGGASGSAGRPARSARRGRRSARRSETPGPTIHRSSGRGVARSTGYRATASLSARRPVAVISK